MGFSAYSHMRARNLTVKCRIGVDKNDSYEDLRGFVTTVMEASGSRAHFVVHARAAWLKGLSAHENRMIPPLKYPIVHRLKVEFPELQISINGGINTWEEVEEQLTNVDGVMVGRQAYKNPWMLAEADERLYGACSPAISRRQ
eukprot:7779853-Pyramimonas_sp.AAC.1